MSDETKQSARELLKEAQSAIMEALKMIGSKRPMGGACGQTVGAEGYQIRGTGWYFGEVEEPLSNAWHDIDAYLSAPSESTIEYGRRVPRAMLEEIWECSWASGGRGQVDGGKTAAINTIAAKHSVVIE